jgi:hypothetical protein
MLKRQQTERAERAVAAAAAAQQAARVHAASLHCFQVHSHGTPPLPSAAAADERDTQMLALRSALAAVPERVRTAVLLELKAGEANQRQVLLVATDDDEQLVLKTCATDSYADAHVEHLSCRIAQRLGVPMPVVHVSRQARPVLERLQGLTSSGRLIALPNETVQHSLWAPTQLATPFLYLMGGARGKTLLELRPAERRKLCPQSVLPAVGRLAAFDALINNWDRWPLPTLWQKDRTYLRMSDKELRAACSSLGRVGGGAADGADGEQAAIAADELLRGCGCNLGNVLFEPATSAVTSIDTCIVRGTPEYAQTLLAVCDEVADAYEARKPSDALRVMHALVAAALQLDERDIGGGADGGGAAGSGAAGDAGGGGADAAARRAEESALLEGGFLEGLVHAAEQLGEAELRTLEEHSLARAELALDAAAADALPVEARDSVTAALSEARVFVGRNVAACCGRLPRLRSVLHKGG